MSIPRITIYVDVDDTIVRSTGARNMPRPDIIKKISELATHPKVDLYLWSSGGGEYARSVATELDIEPLFVAFLPKPTIAIDDVAIQDWSYLKQIHPNELINKEISDLISDT